MRVRRSVVRIICSADFLCIDREASAPSAISVGSLVQALPLRNPSLSVIESQRVRASALNEMIVALDLAVSLPTPRFVQCQRDLRDEPMPVEAGSTSCAVVPLQDIGREALSGGHIERASLLAVEPGDPSRRRQETTKGWRQSLRLLNAGIEQRAHSAIAWSPWRPCPCRQGLLEASGKMES
jgi:hypothetical protein